MPLIFKSVSTMEFDAMEDLEALIRKMPWSEEAKEQLLKNREYVDEDDEVDHPGAGDVVHTFTIEGEE